MNRKLSLYTVFFIATLLNPSLALTLKTSEHYYLVVPSDNDVNRAIYDASPMISNNENDAHKAFKAIGRHQASYDYNYWMKYNKRKCYVDKAVVTLESRIYVPKIDMDARQYTDTILTKFRVEAHDTIIHEKEHRQIYIDNLQNFANKLRAITKESTTFTNCEDLKKHVKSEYMRTVRIMEQQNLNFDCFEYGKKMKLDMCKNATITGQKVKPSAMSSISQGGESGVKSFKDKEKPDEEECDGQLIEPFKGKFYCVPADSYSEL